jgi:hypothetical protein
MKATMPKFSFLVLMGALCGAAEPTAWSPFGIGSCYINNRSMQDNERWVPQMEAIGLKFHNFSLVSDGNVYNKYFLQSVTVTKLTH